MPSQTLSLDLNCLGRLLRGSSKLKLSRIEESGTAGGLTSTFRDEDEKEEWLEKRKTQKWIVSRSGGRLIVVVWCRP